MIVRASRKPCCVGKGVQSWRNVRLTVQFDPATALLISAKAVADGTSASEVVRTLVEWGIESAEIETGRGQ